MYIHIHIHMNKQTNEEVYTYMYLYVYTYAYVYKYIYIYICRSIHKSVLIGVCVYIDKESQLHPRYGPTIHRDCCSSAFVKASGREGRDERRGRKVS